MAFRNIYVCMNKNNNVPSTGIFFARSLKSHSSVDEGAVDWQIDWQDVATDLSKLESRFTYCREGEFFFYSTVESTTTNMINPWSSMVSSIVYIPSIHDLILPIFHGTLSIEMPVLVYRINSLDKKKVFEK